MERQKMPRQQRAKIFAPFTLIGLQEAIKLKEYEHEKIVMRELDEDKVMEISHTLSNLKNGDLVSVKYYYDGYEVNGFGCIKLSILEGLIFVNDLKINLDKLLDIRRVY